MAIKSNIVKTFNPTVMKNTNLMALLIGALCLCTTLTKAQTADTLFAQPNEKAMALADRLEREVNLTEKQKEKVYAVLLERSIQWEKSVKNATKPDKQKQADKVNAKAWKDLNKVLTEEQKQLHQKLRKELKQQKGQQQAISSGKSETFEPTDEDLEMDF